MKQFIISELLEDDERMRRIIDSTHIPGEAMDDVRMNHILKIKMVKKQIVTNDYLIDEVGSFIKIER